MPRRVLISFIGTGVLKENILESRRFYRKAMYSIDNKLYEESFISVVLKNHYQVDTLILIGTMKSIWEEVYSTFCSEKLNEDYYFRLAEVIDNSNYNTEPDFLKFQILEKCIGNNSRIVPVYYGVNQEQFKRNTDIILDVLQQSLQKGDIIYLDVTHAFRSLPLVLSQILFYFQDVSAKQIKIERVFYGMLEVISELGYVPIVDLSNLLELNSLHKGAYAFKTFGNAYLLSERVIKYDVQIARLLKEFSDTKNMNLLYELEQLVKKIKKLDLKLLNEIDRLVIADTIKNFLKYFEQISYPYEFQFSLAKWHFSIKNYSSAIIVFIEAVITYVCYKNDLDWQDENSRNQAKSIILKDDAYKDIKHFYQKINSYRKKIAHSLHGAANTEYIINEVTKGFEKLEKIINT